MAAGRANCDYSLTMISVRSLEHHINGRKVLALPVWDVAKGSEWLVLGPSGSGKTTLINALAGLIKPSHGQIVIQEQEITAMSAAGLDAVRGDLFGIVFQTLRLLPSLTVLQNLQIARRMSGKPHSDQAFDTAMRAVGVDALTDRKPRTLSVGEAQRVAIARAIVTDPKILICDEPTSALDDANAEQVIALLRQVCRYQKLTLIIATHDARVKAHISNCLQLEKQS